MLEPVHAHVEQVPIDLCGYTSQDPEQHRCRLPATFRITYWNTADHRHRSRSCDKHIGKRIQRLAILTQAPHISIRKLSDWSWDEH